LATQQAISTKLAGLEAALAAARTEARTLSEASEVWERERKVLAEQLQVRAKPRSRDRALKGLVAVCYICIFHVYVMCMCARLCVCAHLCVRRVT